MTDFEPLLDRVETLVGEVETLDSETQNTVFQLLDGVDAMHRFALHRLADLVGVDQLRALATNDPPVGWLLDVYGVGVDERAATEAALESVRPYIQSHGGVLELLDVADGHVRLRMAGSCSGCSASAVTLADGIEEALRAGLPGYVGVEVEEDLGAAPHPPPNETPVALTRKAS